MPDNSSAHSTTPRPPTNSMEDTRPDVSDSIRRGRRSYEVSFGASSEFWKLVILEGSGLFILGIAATLLPKLASLAVSLLTGWLLLIAGLFRFASIFSAQGGPGYWGSMLLAGITAILGALLVIFPVDGALSLTLALAVYLCAHGLTSLTVASAMRGATRRWFWIALGAAADFLLAGFVIEGWPNNAPLVLGTFVGINLMIAGIALVLAATGAHVLDRGVFNNQQNHGEKS